MSNLNDIKVSGVPVEIGGKTYNLKYDFNAFAVLEEKYGSIEEVFSRLREMGEKSGMPPYLFSTIRALVWAGILHENESLSEKDIGSMLTLRNIAPIVEKVTEAIGRAMPELTEEEKKEAELKRKMVEDAEKFNKEHGIKKVVEASRQ